MRKWNVVVVRVTYILKHCSRLQQYRTRCKSCKTTRTYVRTLEPVVRSWLRVKTKSVNENEPLNGLQRSFIVKPKIELNCYTFRSLSLCIIDSLMLKYIRKNRRLHTL